MSGLNNITATEVIIFFLVLICALILTIIFVFLNKPLSTSSLYSQISRIDLSVLYKKPRQQAGTQAQQKVDNIIKRE